MQVYTSVLWFWLQAPLRLVVNDPYANALALSLACLLGCVAVARRILGGDRALLLLALLMLGARGFFDYTSSGLETPLVFLACTLLLDRFLAAELAPAGDPSAARPLRHLLWLAGWSLLVRHDLALLWLPPVLQACWRHRRLWPPRRWARHALIGAAPLLAWSAFAVFYYGSPWPNPAVAKLALTIPRATLVAQGLRYLQSALQDPVLVLVIVAGTAVALARRDTRGVGVGIVVHLVYLVWIGGDFMLGRMLGGVFLVAALVLVRAVTARRAVWLGSTAALAAMLAVLLPLTPLNSPRDLADERVRHGVVDERAFYFQATSLWTRLRTPAAEFPVHDWADQGRVAARRDETVVGSPNVGMFGYLAGLRKIVVDRYAITDPLLARLPLARLPADWRPGHIKRDTPDGYGQSLQSGGNRLRDPVERALYADVLLATSAPLLAPGRAGAIWRLNAGLAADPSRLTGPRRP